MNSLILLRICDGDDDGDDVDDVLNSNYYHLGFHQIQKN